MLYIALIALVAGAFGACTNGEYEPGPQVSGPQVSFVAENPTSVEFTGVATENTQKLTLGRVETNEALTVYVITEVERGAEKLFTIPETVTFAAGEATAELVYTVDQESFESDKTYTVKFYLEDEVSTPYGYSEWTVTYALNPWELMKDSKGNNAKAKFRGNDMLTALFNIDAEVEIEVNMYEHKTRKGYYKVEDPWTASIAYGFGYPTIKDALADGLSTSNADFIIDATNPAEVTIAQQALGVDIGYGDMIIESGYPRYFDAAAGAGQLQDGIITFPVKGCIFAMPGYSTSAYYANNSGLFRVVLPGVEIADYTLAVAYDGMDVAADNKTTTAKFKFSYGDDVTGIKYMVVEGNVEADPTAALTTLFAGTDESVLTVEDFKQGGKEAGVKVGLERGMYTVVAAPKDKNGNLRQKEVVVKSFYFVGMGEQVDTTCKFDARLVLPSEYNPELTASYPDQTSLIYMMLGSDITSLSYYLNKSSIVATWEGTPEDLVASYGSAMPTAVVDKVNTETGYVGAFKDLASDTEYTLILVAKNMYGESTAKVLTCKTAAYDYTGELAIGDYMMYCKYVYGNEAAGEVMESENVFNVASNGGSNTDYLVTNIGIENGAVWHAKYDSAAGTLTLDGTELGYEQYGNQFGALYGYYDAEKTMVYGYFSYASAESTGNDPLVLSVDATSKQLNALVTPEFAIQVHQNSEATKYPLLGYAAYYVNNLTVVAPYSATASTKSVKNQAVVPFRNAKGVRNLVAPKSKFSVNIKSEAVANTASKSVKAVKPSVVENYAPVKVLSKTVKANAKAIVR